MLTSAQPDNTIRIFAARGKLCESLDNLKRPEAMLPAAFCLYSSVRASVKTPAQGDMRANVSPGSFSRSSEATK